MPPSVAGHETARQASHKLPWHAQSLAAVSDEKFEHAVAAAGKMTPSQIAEWQLSISGYASHQSSKIGVYMNKTFPVEQLQKTKELFPRIVDSLELLWGYPEFDAYLNSLTSETREVKRQGFPPEVAEELLKLQMGGLGRDDNWTVL